MIARLNYSKRKLPLLKRCSIALMFLVGVVSNFAVAEPPPGKGGGNGGGGGDGDGGGLTNPAFVAPGDKGLFLVGSDGTAERLTRTKGQELDVRAVWSPDGSRIAFKRHPNHQYVDQDLYIIQPDGTGQTLIRSFVFGDDPVPDDLTDGLVWSPDGSQLIFPGGNNGQLWSVRLDGSLELIFDLTAYMDDGRFWRSDDQLSFSPDLSDESGYQGYLAFTGWPTSGGSKADIYQLDVTIDPAGTLFTGSLTNVTQTAPEVHEQSPSWNPLGMHLLFNRYNDGLRQWDAVLRDLISGEETVVLPANDTYNFSWSPGGVYVGFGAGELFYFDPWAVDATPVFVAEGYTKPDWNPNWINDIDP